MRVKFDDGKFVEDLKRVVDDALNRQPALIVVPTEREVNTFERNFKNYVDGHNVWCCSASDYHNGVWRVKFAPAPKHIYGFRDDDIWNLYACDARVEYVTTKSYKKRVKEEETNEEI